LGVVAAGGERGEVEEGAGAEGDRDRRFAAVDPPGDPGEQGEDRDRAGQARQLRAAGGVEAIVGGGPDSQRLQRRDRAVGVAAGDFVEAVGEAEGADQGDEGGYSD
jgi:hypothetical protein